MQAQVSTPRLSRAFYRRDALVLARGLLGQRLVSQIGGIRTSGIIVETEAYLGIPDKAAHTYGGRKTARNRSMWGDGGTAYVYLVYGMHHCFNVVAGPVGEPIAVLVRGLQPDGGQGVMFERRRVRRETDLASGPGKVCQALGIDRQQDGTDLVDGRLLYIERLRRRALPSRAITAAPRIGIPYAGEWQRRPLRLYIEGNPHVSRGAEIGSLRARV